MKVAPVSADLLIELTVAALAVGALVYAGKRASTAVGAQLQSLKDSVGGAVDTIAQLPGRAVDAASQAARAVTPAAVSSYTLAGGWDNPAQFFESTDPGVNADARAALGDFSSGAGEVRPQFTGGATGSW